MSSAAYSIVSNNVEDLDESRSMIGLLLSVERNRRGSLESDLKTSTRLFTFVNSFQSAIKKVKILCFFSLVVKTSKNVFARFCGLDFKR